MFRLNKLSDYGLVLLTHLAAQPAGRMASAIDIAGAVGLPLPTVGKLLKALARSGLLVSHRGAKGGYSLARPPAEVSVTEIIQALEGPLAITECSQGVSCCEYEDTCRTGPHWKRINLAIAQALDRVTLLDLAFPVGSDLSIAVDSRPISVDLPVLAVDSGKVGVLQ